MLTRRDDIPRIVISGTGSGAGKTSISTAIMSSLSERSSVQSYKIGPDFIDPMYHRMATGRPSRNLDGYMMDRETIVSHFQRTSADADLAVVEGVRGLYEGLDAIEDTASTAQIAKFIRAPVILVVDSRSLTRSAAAIVKGFKYFDPAVNIAGVILNNVSGETHKRKLCRAITELADTEVLGVVYRDRERSIPGRHLGLVTPDSDTDLSELRANLESLVEEVDIDRIREIAESAPDISLSTERTDGTRIGEGLVAAVPYDRAFCFYYPENLERLEGLGVKVLRYSPTEGDDLPEADIHYLGGGYPELYAEQISRNTSFIKGLKQAHDEGAFIRGECGGMMVMCQGIRDMNGDRHRMAGIFPAEARMHPVRQGLSYVEAKDVREGGIRIRGHEFHYSDVSIDGMVDYAYRMMRGRGIDGNHDGLLSRNCIGTYMHRHALSVDDPVLRLVREAANALH